VRTERTPQNQQQQKQHTTAATAATATKIKAVKNEITSRYLYLINVKMVKRMQHQQQGKRKLKSILILQYLVKATEFACAFSNNCSISFLKKQQWILQLLYFILFVLLCEDWNFHKQTVLKAINANTKKLTTNMINTQLQQQQK